MCRSKVKARLETGYGEWVERIPAWTKWATQVCFSRLTCSGSSVLRSGPWNLSTHGLARHAPALLHMPVIPGHDALVPSCGRSARPVWTVSVEDSSLIYSHTGVQVNVHAREPKWLCYVYYDVDCAAGSMTPVNSSYTCSSYLPMSLRTMSPIPSFSLSLILCLPL